MPWARSWILERDRRVALGLSFAVVSSFVLASFYPMALLALGPLLLGVPHLFSDIRYLVVRPGFHKRPILWLVVVVPLVLVCVMSDARWGGAAILGAAVVARGPLGRRGLFVAVGALSILLAHAYGYGFMLFVAHFHNLFALFILFVWRPVSKPSLAILPLALFAIASAVIMLGLYEPFLRLSDGDFSFRFHLDLDTQAPVLGPLDAGIWGPRLVIFYAFAQSVHYAVWLRVLPDQARASRTPRSFRQSARVFVREMSTPVALIALALSIALALYAAHDVVSARSAYFQFALFHGYLEFAAVALFYCEGSIARARGDESLPALRTASTA
jgi:hypothetical protein